MLSNSSSSNTLPRWNQLYERAIRELDNTKLSERVAEARHAILNRAEELLDHSFSEERHVLNHALRTLKLLEEKAAREMGAAVPAKIEEIENLFDTLFAQSTVAQRCEHCGAEKFNLNAMISLANSGRRWKIQLPVCPKCDQAEYLKLISREAA